MIKIGVLSSYNGSGFIALQKACESGYINAKIVVVISNNTNANVLTTAQNCNINNYCINTKNSPNENVDLKILNTLKENGCDYIFLSGFMKKIDGSLIESYPNKIVNCHPALLPNFGGQGMYGRFVHEAVVKAKAPKTGVTVHFVNENYDEGEHILQNEILVSPTESVDSVENRVKEIETSTIVEAFKKLIKD
ncbi:MAG: phosphoribosylglycinamide formyltransferase [Campylobacteraceae bacterium]|nr:phosphoribosylglycinamide formyltransferase [Campylobacteraceae bacterium]